MKKLKETKRAELLFYQQSRALILLAAGYPRCFVQKSPELTGASGAPWAGILSSRNASHRLGASSSEDGSRGDRRDAESCWAAAANSSQSTQPARRELSGGENLLQHPEITASTSTQSLKAQSCLGSPPKKIEVRHLPDPARNRMKTKLPWVISLGSNLIGVG